MNVEGSVAFVTGANRGLGAAYARALLDGGAAKVYAAVRRPEAITDPRLTFPPSTTPRPPSRLRAPPPPLWARWLERSSLAPSLTPEGVRSIPNPPGWGCLVRARRESNSQPSDP